MQDQVSGYGARGDRSYGNGAIAEVAVQRPRRLSGELGRSRRLELIRERIQLGYYDRPEVVDRVALSLTLSGDLWARAS